MYYGNSVDTFNNNREYKFLLILESKAKTDSNEMIDLDLEMQIESD